MSRADRYLRACRREEPDCTPVWFMRQAGRYLPEYRAIRSKVGFLELCKTPDLAAEVTIQPVTRLGVDAAILFSDILVVSEAMGMALELEDKGPHFPEPLRSHADVDRLRVPDPEQALGFVLETIRAAKKRLAGTVPLIGFCGGPWTLAAYMIEGKTSRSFEKAKAALLGDEPLAFALLSKISDALIAYLQAQIDAGADALQIFDSWAGALAPDDYARIGAPYIARVVRGLRRNGQPLTVFGVETGELLHILAGTGADMVGVDWRVPLSKARQRTGEAVALQGNLDPASLFLPQPILEERVRRVLAEARAAGPGHVFNLGHGILPTTPPENAKLVVDLVHRETSHA
ncbi:MAG: uroporphyrinogen decarboxylase [Deltaproteobacteria bacterium]|nr:MAG: uroporphyrinogen decarboxylase [Deltaproteobacteria bacterium]TMB33673.1 MAG: uroporphyrinogen decarboxylase [Deltaproteobacteria bacterium]